MSIKRTLLVLALVAAGSLKCISVHADEPNEGYSIRTWQTEEGLPQNTVTAITQTRDGYIWIGTFGGLARFDGEHFRNFKTVNTPTLSDNRISSLFEDSAGVLWIGHDSGKVTRYHGGQFETVVNHGSSHEKVAAIGTDTAKTSWLVRQNGVVESLLSSPSTLNAHAGAPPVSCAFARNSAGLMWILTDGAVSQLSDGKLVPINFGRARQSGFVMGIGAASDGSFWVVRDGSVRKWSEGNWLEDRGPSPSRSSTPITSVLELQDGTLAVGTMDEGLHLLFADGRKLHFDHSNGLPQNWVRFLYEDREGNLWVGAGTGGLVAVRPTAFTVINPPDHWQGRAVLSVAPAPDGALWIGTEGAGLYRYLGGVWTIYNHERGIKNPYVWSVAASPEGKVWAGTWGGGVYQLEGDNFTPTPGLAASSAPVLALQYTTEDRTLWAGIGTGLLSLKENTTAWPFRSPEGVAANVCTVARDKKGGMWFGLSEGGLIRFAEGKLTHFYKTDGLSSNSVQCLLADGEVLWIGTPDGGLNRLKDGRFSTIGLDQGLASEVICHIEDDGQGYLWLSTHHGILRLSKDELNRCADGKSATVSGQVYDRNDGLPTIEYSGGLQAAGCKTTDGRLWFTSSKGLVSVDPAHIRLNPLPPPVVIESLRVDARLIETMNVPTKDLQLPPDHQRLEFQYTALSLAAANKVLFKYRLVGVDKGWVNAGAKRTAFYSHLPPGDYRFQVIACNNDNLWNETGASFSFSVRPFYWQTWWFRGFAGLSILTLVGWTVRHQTHRRMQIRLEQVERERAVEAERARIAQDIHDDIGASLTRITMLSQSVCPEANAVSPATTEVLHSIWNTTREVTRSLDEIVWAISPRHDSLDSLVSYMGKFANDVLSAAHVRCRLDLPVDLPPWPLTTQTRHNLLLAFKEALNNAVRHADATEVRVSLRLKPNGFEITIDDNGRGFTDLSPKETQKSRPINGNGLGNLHRRLAEIGGQCETTSKPGEGSRVTFIVPVADSSVLPPAR